MNRLRLTVIHEFDWHGEELNEESVNRLTQNFLSDPTDFLHPHELEWDEILIVDVEDITDGN